MKINFKITFLSIVSIILIGCGGGSSAFNNSKSQESTLLKGVLYDSVVIGARYKTATLSGITDSNGIFKYHKGEEVEFFINNISIGKATPKDVPNSLKDKVKANKIVTPQDLSKDNANKTIKVAQFLISLDSDNNASNGIDIDISKLKDENKTVSIDNIDLDNVLHTKVPKTKAKEHLCKSLGFGCDGGTETRTGTDTGTGTDTRNDNNQNSIVQNINSFATATISKSYWDNTSNKSETKASYEEIVDGNKSNTIYIKAYNGKSWVQLEFPQEANISRLKIYVHDYNSSIGGVSVYALDKSYTSSMDLNDPDKIASLEGKTLNDIKISNPKASKYILLKKDNNGWFALSEVETYGKFNKLFFENYEDNITLQSAFSIGDIVANFSAVNKWGKKIKSYAIEPSDAPFSIDSNGNLKIDGALEAKDYNLTIVAKDGADSSKIDITIHSKRDTKSLTDAQKIFMQKAKSFNSNSNLDELIDSYLEYAHKKEKLLYKTIMPNDLPQEFWDKIENDSYLKEGLYASRFPANPYSVKNLYDFFKKWKEDGKSDAFIEKYKNVALGLAINAKERGIFDNPIGGDTWEHKVIDYEKLPDYEAKARAWLSSFSFKKVGDVNDFKNYLYVRYKLTRAQKDSITKKTNRAFKKMQQDGIDILNATPEQREKYKLSYAGQNMLRVINSLDRLDCFATGNPCQKIKSYLDKHSSLTINRVLGYFKDYKSKIGLSNEPNSLAYDLRGKFNIVPEENNIYKLMPFYDLANWKISLNEIPPIDFNDSEPNWPIFDFNLTKLPWQIMALEQDAQKQECEYVKSRFFETDKAKLRESYPPNAIDGGKKAEKRFIQYTTYTWDYDRPEVWFRNSNWTPDRTVYRVLQDGGVCGRQSTMGQHVNECLNRPSIGVGQPAHRAWVGVYMSKDIPNQFITKIGYDVYGKEFSYAHIRTLYNQYTKAIRPDGLEKFTGVVTGTSPANSGEHKYNQSMILQHIAHILEKEGYSPVALLKKAVEIAPTNSDAWYQLALYYASQNDLDSIDALAREYQRKRDSFFMDSGSNLANNLEAVTARNIEFAMLQAPSVDWGKGSRASYAKELIWKYLDDFEDKRRSTSSYNVQNRLLENYYLIAQNDKDSFKQHIKELFEKFVTDGYNGYTGNYFKHMNFTDINKTALIDELANILEASQLSDNQKDKIYKNVLNRSRVAMLAEVTLNGVCADGNLTKCTSKKSFDLNKSAIYMTLDDIAIGKFGELDASQQGKEGSTILPIPVVDNNGNASSIKIHIAKVTSDGKLLKINDPTPVNGTETKIVTWIDPSDNQIQEGKTYSAVKKLILKVKYRDTNNEYLMGSVSININNLMQGHNEQ